MTARFTFEIKTTTERKRCDRDRETRDEIRRGTNNTTHYQTTHSKFDNSYFILTKGFIFFIQFVIFQYFR